MKLRILAAATLTTVLALDPVTASAKGAKELTVIGPGLAAPIRLTNEASGAANKVAEKAGLFEHSSDRVLANRPSGDLGPRYVATYDWLIAQDTTTPLRQDLYPFADGGAAAYTPPRQNVGGSRPPGGWYRGGEELTVVLVAVGVPAPASYASPVPVVAPPPFDRVMFVASVRAFATGRPGRNDRSLSRG